jgi:3-dehydroquinate dehydratase-2
VTVAILLLSGPNLDQLGVRAPDVYGTDTLGQVVERFTRVAATFGATVEHRQSNFEGDLVESVHDAGSRFDAIVINPGALTHYSWSLLDALETYPGITIEVHLSNPGAREEFRHRSTVAAAVTGTIAGFRAYSYDLAAYAVRDLLAATSTDSAPA